MKRIIIILFALASLQNSFAQNNLNAADDLGRIALTPVIIEESGIPSYAKKVLSSKLKEMATKNGMASTTVSPRFVITASVNLLNKEMTSTAPPMTAVELATTIYIGDAISGQLFSTYTYNSVKGLGTNDQRAYLAAFKNLKASENELATFIDNGKQKIIEYYNSQIDFLLAEAKSLSDKEDYEGAMNLLASVPDVCKEAYTKAMKEIAIVYQKKIDVEGAKFYNQANAAWSTNKSEEGAKACIDLLANINPLSSSAAAGNALVKQIESHYAEIAAYNRMVKEREWEYKVMVEAEERQLQRDKMNLNHELAMRQSDNASLASQMALEEVKKNTELFLKKGPSIVTDVVEKISTWFL